MILLDTQAFVWLLQDDSRLGVKSEQLIEESRAEQAAYVSTITFWEMSMLVDKGRLDLGREILSWVSAALDAPGFLLAPFTPEIAVDAGSLPGDIHGDPADRILIATARHLACPLLTSDHRILNYAAKGHVQALDAHR